MKFRTSFQISREPREEGSPTATKPNMPFKVPSLRKKDSKAVFAKEKEERLNGEGSSDEKETGDGQLRASRKQAIQDFFKNTGTNLKATGANLRASTAKMPKRMPTRRTRAARPSSQRSPDRSLDIKDDVLDKLMGPGKAPVQGKIQSDEFFLKQRIRASSRTASAGISPMSSRSQAEHDRTPLSAEEITEMFTGAPYFKIEKSRKKTGGLKPQVIFRGWDVEESAKYARDYAPLGHSTFGACTLGIHRTREAGERPMSWSLDTSSRMAVDWDLLEVPNMLSAKGQDVGTVGFEHFLELPIADSGVVPQEPGAFDKRKLLLFEPERLGQREMNMEMLIDRLTELGELYASEAQTRQAWSEEKIAEMGEDLFGKVLDSELGTTGAGTGSVALRTQIAALQKVLNEVELWWDFSQVEWRIRVGQLLWASHEDEAPNLDEDRHPSDRDVLLLQITLAAELLVRLDAVKALTAGASSFPPVISSEELETLESERTRKIQWDLLLAERFLENLSISAKVNNTSKANKRSSLFSAITFLTAKETPEEAEQSVQPILFPKQEERQLAGLVYFAEALHWPHVKEVQTELEAKLSLGVKHAGEDAVDHDNTNRHSQRPTSVISMYATPLSSPLLPGYTPSSNRQSYFGGQSSPHSRRPGLSRMTTAQSVQLLPAVNEGSRDGGDKFQGLGGWLSRSWLAGLTLPGEPSSHFLISTLLENSPDAIEALGDSANLYGGFIYDGRSFWSTSCVVGRVMGAVAGARECMGWISIPGIANQRNLEDGWVDLEVKDMPSTIESGFSSTSNGPAADLPRIKDAEAVARSSDPLHGTTINSIQAGDFMLPIDGPPVMGNEVRFSGLSFKATPSAGAPGDDSTGSIAYLTFASPINTRLAKLEVPLTYDVHFVSSYPCHPRGAPTGRAKSRAGSKVSSHVVKTSNKIDEEDQQGVDAERRQGSQPDVSPLEATPPPSGPIPTTGHGDKDLTTSSLPQPSDDAAGTTAPAATQSPTDSACVSAVTSLPSLPLDPKKNITTTTLEKALPPPPAHPLHIDFHFDTIPVATLLTAPTSDPSTSRPRALSSPEDRQQLPVGAKEDEDEVVVLDCRGTENLELLARAWCAKVGENALVGKTGRTCLACCVREARGLNIRVVIRI